MVTGTGRLIALDIDGTLLTTTETLLPRTRAALTEAEASGWHVVLVTGRPLAIAFPVVHDLALGEYVVAANGATVAAIANSELLYQANLPGRVAAAAVRRAREAVPGVGVTVTTERGFVREPGFERLAPQVEAASIVVEDACPRDDDVVYNLVLFVHGMETRALADAVRPVLPEQVAAEPSGLPGSVELVPPGTHKATGVAYLCERLGIDRRDVVAFGDGLNDHELLVWAGLGVAMGNADDDTKALADDVTASNDEDGIAVVLERLLTG